MDRTGSRAARRASALLIPLIFSVLLIAPARGYQLEEGADPWFAARAFIGMGGCLLVQEGQLLEPGDRLHLFESGQRLKTRAVQYLVNADSVQAIFERRHFNGVYQDRELWNRIGCWWGLRDAFPPALAIARYDAADSAEDALPLALKGLPDSALTLGGNGELLSRGQLDALERDVAPYLPKGFHGEGVLRAGIQYRSEGAEELTEVFVGRPAYNHRGVGAPIDSIEIYHVFLHQGHVLASERFSRVSGEEERVDTEPPQLDDQNWFQTMDETMGYLSPDGGETWNQLSVNIGFEGIVWTISRLEQGLPPLWRFYLYTSH